MVYRQALYRQRFPDAYPPLLPTLGFGGFHSLVSASEVAHLLTLPTARMKAVPVRRLTIPRLPPPPEIARTDDLPSGCPEPTRPAMAAAALADRPMRAAGDGMSATAIRPAFRELSYRPYPVANSDLGPVVRSPR